MPVICVCPDSTLYRKIESPVLHSSWLFIVYLIIYSI
uniref:Uncharacterized protein n=1 Tax=Aegilops tauschii subsp. strangulata TaxID=200361 RepID=A0A453PSD0_AEGTS